MGRMGLLSISDADAVVGEVLSPKTFYAVALPRKTGTMATQTLNPANENVPAGYYAVTTLSAVDGDLASGNIKATITLFGFAGSNDVRDISDADLVAAEAPTGKFFYAVAGGRKTGSGTQTLNAANETVNAGYYAATTLSTVDADLAVGNIKSGITIFGFLGTLGPSMDVEATQLSTITATTPAGNKFWYKTWAVTTVLATTTPTFAANSWAYGTATLFACTDGGSWHLQCVLDGVVVGSTAISGCTANFIYTYNVAAGSKQLVGAKTCTATLYETTGGGDVYAATNQFGARLIVAMISVGSVKV